MLYKMQANSTKKSVLNQTGIQNMNASKGIKASAGAVKLSLLGLTFGAVTLSLVSFLTHADGWLPDSGTGSGRTAAPNVILNNEISSDGLRVGGIANTRHNLTMSYNGQNQVMDPYRNNYYEICVYCHTPHGANSTAAAPLWNRTVTQRTYTLFNQDNTPDKTNFFEPTMLDLTYTQPGPNSLTCLSCHDGATAIDSIINMPTQMTGEFRAGYSNNAETLVESEFLDAWSGNKLGMGSPGDIDPATNLPQGQHAGFNSQDSSLCITCHNPGSTGVFSAPDFKLFSIGDRYVSGGYNKATGEIDTTSNLTQQKAYLADDHPIGVKYPEEFGPDVDYNEPDVKIPKIAFFDNNGNGHADPDEIRLYDSGDGYEVECGSCHDPHGIKVGTASSNELIPSFLRVGAFNADVERAAGLSNSRAQVSANNGSSLCLTCHVK